MKFKQFYLGCLSHASYYIGSNNEAAIIDPQRDVKQYLDEAAANNQQIKYVIETHSHADFVSGHIELSAKTGAQIIYGHRADTAFDVLKVNDGDELNLGGIQLTFFETPGHTPESITISARDTEDASAPLKLFTGDTLFIGDVGRPDLIGSKGYTVEDMGGMLYDSLHQKIMVLPDDTEVYPAHGAGSLCGKSLSSETWSTLGNQKSFNYALKPMSKSEFVRLISCDQPQVPAYFPKSAESNLAGPVSLDDLPKPRSFTSEEVTNFDGVVLDVGNAAEFGAGHVPNSINIGLSGKFATWTGTLIPFGTPIAIVADTVEKVDEAFMRLARIGFESVGGYILIDEFSGRLNTVPQLTPDEAAVRIRSYGKCQFVDVREVGEYLSGHAAGTINLPLGNLSVAVERLDPENSTFVICQSGYRSSLATSVLENAGFNKVCNVSGGTIGWKDAGLEIESST